MSGIILDRKWEDEIWLKVVFVLQAMQVPILLVTVFELTYFVHKRRSVSFFGMHFDEGRLGQSVQGVFSTPVKSLLFRNLLRILAILLLGVGIIVNLDLLRDFAESNEYAGRTGWWNLWTKEDGGQIWTILDTHVLMSLIPPLVLVFFSTCLSIALWRYVILIFHVVVCFLTILVSLVLCCWKRYGTSISMVVHSSFLNPWFFPLFGTIAIAAGQLFSVTYYPITSNTGFFIYVLTLVLLMVEIDKDIVKTAELTDFLERVAKKGDEISVKRWKKETYRPLTVKETPTLEEPEDGGSMT